VKENKDNISLLGAVSMGTGVMVGAGIFALTGEIANYAGNLLMWAFICAGAVAGITSYTYIKMSNAYPSSGGIGMILTKVYGKSTIAAWGALLMLFSMIINQSLVARTFGNYLVQSKYISLPSDYVPWLGLGLVIVSLLINILSNKWIQSFSFVMAIIKAVGLMALAVGGLAASGISLPSLESGAMETSPLNFIGAVAVGVLAFKGFTTITNSGGEITNPNKNVGRAIIISLAICVAIYILVTLAVGSSLSLDEILKAKNYSLAEAARPTYGELGVSLTVLIAIIATVSGIIASMFAVSRMLTMLTEMELVPHSHFGMPGSIHKHILVYIAVMAGALTIVFDVSRIAALGAFYYIAMDFIIHYGVLKNANRDEVSFNPSVLKASIGVDLIILIGLIYIKGKDDPVLLGITIVSMTLIYILEKWFLKAKK
tara:strand:+ start:187242 stop:188528 length:1287 start_codon:yes stop_codon:yes gene_type:complete